MSWAQNSLILWNWDSLGTSNHVLTSYCLCLDSCGLVPFGFGKKRERENEEESMKQYCALVSYSNNAAKKSSCFSELIILPQWSAGGFYCEAATERAGKVFADKAQQTHRLEASTPMCWMNNNIKVNQNNDSKDYITQKENMMVFHGQVLWKRIEMSKTQRESLESLSAACRQLLSALDFWNQKWYSVFWSSSILIRLRLNIVTKS